MGHIIVNTGPVMGEEVAVSDTAAATVRMKSNVSGLRDVDVLKSIAAAFITECERIRDAGGPGARDAAIAITKMQGASMFGVAAATAHL